MSMVVRLRMGHPLRNWRYDFRTLLDELERQGKKRGSGNIMCRWWNGIATIIELVNKTGCIDLANVETLSKMLIYTS